MSRGPRYPQREDKWLSANKKGVGRIWRDGYFLRIGDAEKDIDELRCHGVASRLLPLLKKLNPPITGLECAWIMEVFGFMSYPLWGEDLVGVLYELRGNVDHNYSRLCRNYLNRSAYHLVPPTKDKDPVS